MKKLLNKSYEITIGKLLLIALLKAPILILGEYFFLNSINSDTSKNFMGTGVTINGIVIWSIPLIIFLSIIFTFFTLAFTNKKQ